MKKVYRILCLCLISFSLFTVSAQALTLSPARIEVKGDPGQIVESEVLLINDQSETQTFYSSSENFEAQGETGTPTFVTAEEGLSSWITVKDKIVLGKGEQKKIPFTVKIPKDAEAGGHFAAIFLSTAPPSAKGGQVSVGAKIGVLVLLRVSGDIKEGGGVLDFKTSKDTSFFTSLPISFSYRFQNSGNDRVNPLGYIQINNSLGFKTDSLDANPTKGNILPESVRRFDVVWGQDTHSSKGGFIESLKAQFSNFALGFYTAHLELTYGSEGKTSLSKTFFVFPWQLLLVSFFVLGFGFIVLRQIIVRYNRWIIKKAQQNIVQK